MMKSVDAVDLGDDVDVGIGVTAATGKGETGPSRPQGKDGEGLSVASAFIFESDTDIC
jgi:hypothetical protein